jgi:hypothetical protein
MISAPCYTCLAALISGSMQEGIGSNVNTLGKCNSSSADYRIMQHVEQAWTAAAGTSFETFN